MNYTISKILHGNSCFFRLKPKLSIPHATSFLIIAVLFICFLCQSAVANEEKVLRESIGKVVVLIGDVTVVRHSGLSEPLKKGASLYVGDLIETGSAGHVHIKFIDEGAVSVRLKSRLRIEEYIYNEKFPKKSAIRFTLEKGVVRSISGKATKAAHERYRLNTPVAALGVLGTDYTVKASENKILVAVYSGGVAVAPLGYNCLAESLGVCAGATQLTKEMGDLVLLYRSGEQQVQLKALSEAWEGNGVIDVEQVPEVELLNSTDSPVEDRLAEREQLGEGLGDAAGNQRELSGALQWGRWWNEPLSGDEFSAPYDEARQGRKITVGNQRFGLFRDAETSFQLMPKQGAFSFDLVRSFVYFFDAEAVKGSSPTIGSLDSGRLDIDFTNNSFTTELDLSHSEAGKTTLGVNGSIRDNGIFSAKNATSSVAAALTGDGREVGLLFEHKINKGIFRGISDWTR